MGLTADERAQLQSKVEQRSDAPAVWILLAMLLGFAALIAILAASGGTGDLSAPWHVVVPLLPFALVVAIAVPMLIRARRRRPGPLVEGTDPATRKAVMRAISAGSAPDPRIDDLVVDLREHGWARKLGRLAAIQSAGGAALVAAAFLGDESATRYLLAGAAAAMLIAAGLLLRRRRQLLTYRAGVERADGPPAAAKGD